MPSADPVAALGRRLGDTVTLERPGDPTHGDYATNAAMKLAGARRRPPRELAAELVATAETLSDVARA